MKFLRLKICYIFKATIQNRLTTYMNDKFVLIFKNNYFEIYRRSILIIKDISALIVFANIFMRCKIQYILLYCIKIHYILNVRVYCSEIKINLCHVDTAK